MLQSYPVRQCEFFAQAPRDASPRRPVLGPQFLARNGPCRGLRGANAAPDEQSRSRKSTMSFDHSSWPASLFVTESSHVKLLASGGSSSAGRASVCGTECRGFKPRLPPQPFSTQNKVFPDFALLSRDANRCTLIAHWRTRSSFLLPFHAEKPRSDALDGTQS